MEVLVLFGWLFVIYIILLGGTLAICSFLAWKYEKRRQIERNLRIKKEFHDTAALCYDVLQFKERGGAGKYFVLYEEGKEYSIHRPFIILDTIHDDRGQKAFEKMYQKTWK